MEETQFEARITKYQGIQQFNNYSVAINNVSAGISLTRSIGSVAKNAITRGIVSPVGTCGGGSNPYVCQFIYSKFILYPPPPWLHP